MITCFDLAKAGVFDPAYLTGNTAEDHLNCEKGAIMISLRGSQFRWCYPCDDFFGGSPDVAMDIARRKNRIKIAKS